MEAVVEIPSGDDPNSDTSKDYIILQPDRIRHLGSFRRLVRFQGHSLHPIAPPQLVPQLRHRKTTKESTKSSPLRRNRNSGRSCLEIFEIKNMLSVGCGHLFCESCWKDFNDGPGCLNMLCPEVEPVVGDDDRNKYYDYLRRSYIDCSKDKKWCPRPGCEFAVQFVIGKCETYDVRCDCSHKFCWNCREECHRPVDCATVPKWIEKNSSEEDNVSWIAVYTMCKQPWKDSCHCNDYHDNLPKEGKRMQDPRRELERYVHYYERWASNNRSRDIALADMDRVENELIPKLSDLIKEPETLLRFIMEAWEQIVECRRVLKWTYAYGYYMDQTMLKKKKFFEYLQGEAEEALERLHHCAEIEMKSLNKVKCSSVEFCDYLLKLTHLTVVTGSYFQNLVKVLENNLCEV